MKNANRDASRLRQPNVLPFSASWTRYLGNLGCYDRDCTEGDFPDGWLHLQGARWRDAASVRADTPAAVVNRPSFGIKRDRDMSRPETSDQK